MTQSAKVTITIGVVVALACLAIWAQFASVVVEPINLTRDDLEKYVAEYLPASEVERLASDPEQRKGFTQQLKRALAVGQMAEQEGFLTKESNRMRVELQIDSELARAYMKNHPERISAEEVASFHAANPASFESFVQMVGRDKFDKASETQKDSVKRGYGEIRLAAQRARQDKIDQQPAMRVRLLIAKYDLLGGLYAEELKQTVDKAVTDAEISQEYRTRSATGELDEVRVRQILISWAQEPAAAHADEPDADAHPAPKLTKEEARKKADALLQRIRAGEDFARVAEQNSDDPGSKVKGGDLGYLSRGQSDAVFDAVAFSATAGQVSDVVETENGFRIIKVEDRRTPPLDARLQQTISAKLKKEKHEAAIERVIARSKVDVPDDFKVAAAAAPQGEPAPAGQR